MFSFFLKAHFREIYLTSYLIGEGLSGFLPSLFALAQGVGGNPECRNVTHNDTDQVKLEPYYPDPRFSVSQFFFVLFLMMLGSAAAFLGLNRLPFAKRERIDDHNRMPVASVKNAPGLDESVADKEADLTFHPPDDNKIELAHSINSGTNQISRGTLIFLLSVQCWICALSNGALPSIQSYSCLPYGNVAYHLAVTLSSMANPLACSIAFFLPLTNSFLVALFSLIGTGISCYILALAALSPNPPLLGYAFGEALMVNMIIIIIGNIIF